MQKADFRRQLRQAFDFTHEKLDCLRTVSSLESLPADDDFNRVALNPTATYEEIYRAAVSASSYNFMLADFSVFQFSWTATDRWRLAYLPNPWITGVASNKDLVEEWEALEGLAPHDDEAVAQLVSELPIHSAVPPVRFEIDCPQYREIAHPAAHLHIGRHTENRWPLSRPLHPFSFALIIFKLYYPELWRPKSTFFDYTGDDCFDLLLIDQLQKMPLVHAFSDKERGSFHFHSVPPVDT